MITKSMFVIGGIGLCSLILAGCRPQQTSQATPEPSSPTTQTNQADTASLLARAMNQNEKIQCVFTHRNTGNTAMYYVQGKKFRMDGMIDASTPTQKSFVISDTQYLYTWTEPDKKGVKMQIPSQEDLQKQQEQFKQQIPDFSAPEALESYESQYTIGCEPGVFTDTIFALPPDVEFQDTSAMMDAAMKAVEESMSPEQQQQLQESLRRLPQ